MSRPRSSHFLLMAERTKIPLLLNSLDKRNKVNGLQPFCNVPHLRSICINFALHHARGGNFKTKIFPFWPIYIVWFLLSVPPSKLMLFLFLNLRTLLQEGSFFFLFKKKLTTHIGELIKSKSQPFLNAIDVSVFNSEACVLRTAEAVTFLVPLH